MKKLVLGCGPHHKPNSEECLVDIRRFPNVDVVHDLNVLPWPFPDESYYGIVGQHIVEHLQCQLVPFMDECWRILKPGGSLYLETPRADGDARLCWDDPTHVRCYTAHSFINYLSPEGVARFGYTSRAWNFVHLQPLPANVDILVVHAFPIKN